PDPGGRHTVSGERRMPAIIGITIIVVCILVFALEFGRHETPTDGRTPPALARLVQAAGSTDDSQRRSALNELGELFLDPSRSTLGIKTSRVENITPEEWFRSGGATQVVEVLDQHFANGWEERQAHTLLVALADRYPETCRPLFSNADSGDGLRSPLEPGGSAPLRGNARLAGSGVSLARSIASASPRSFHDLYRLEESDAILGPLLAAACLAAYEEKIPENVRSRLVRLLRRVPDGTLRPIALHRRAAEGWVGRHWKKLATDRGPGYRDMDDWCERADYERSRRELFEQALFATTPAEIERGLDRFRWDPLPKFDAKVIALTGDERPSVRSAAVLALRAIPTDAGRRRLAAALEEPSVREAAARVLRAQTGERTGFDRGRWDLRALPGAELAALDAWRVVAKQPPPAHASPNSPNELLAYVRRIPLLVNRGELEESAVFDLLPAIAAGGLDRTSDPALRAAAWRTVSRWQRPPPEVLVRAIVTEEDPAVRDVLVDALLLHGPDGVGGSLRAAVDHIAETQRFDGIEVVRGTAIAFPQVRLLEPLLERTLSANPRIRAAAAYLLGGVTLPTEEERRGRLLGLVDLLFDDHEGPRYWAHASLRSLLGDPLDDAGESVHYNPGSSTVANERAVRAWRRHVLEPPRLERKTEPGS
ncbi:MAG: hypothetical protein AAF488_07255, partial [Planctomycetota bacterium]